MANFSFTTIRNFQPGTFANNARLQTLVLSDSFASSEIRFESGTFQPLVGLQHLDMSRCFCRQIPSDSFATMAKLRTLKLRRSYLTKLPNFRNSSQLRLPGSNGSTASPWNNPELEVLDLSMNNRLSIVRGESSAPFPPSVRVLDLSSDPLRLIDDKLLGNLEELEVFRLENSRLRDISARAFKKNRNLKKVTISRSNVEELPSFPGMVEVIWEF